MSQRTPTPKPYGWHCELVHTETGEVIRDTFSRAAPIEGPANVAGFEWRSTALYERNAIAQAQGPGDCIVNATKYTLPEIAKQWGVRVHLTTPPHGGKVWLGTRNHAELTCLRCIASVSKAQGSAS